MSSGLSLSLFFLKPCRIQHNQLGQLSACSGGDDFAPKTSIHQKRYSTAMIEVGVSEQKVIYISRIKTKRRPIFFIQFVPSLVKAAIDQYLLAAALDQMT